MIADELGGHSWSLETPHVENHSLSKKRSKRGLTGRLLFLIRLG